MPSQVISDINPNSLGGLQPIRPPQTNIVVPNPLNVTPFFQGQQLLNQQRQMDQEDQMMAFRNKQLEFQESSLLFQQTKELLDMNNAAFGEFYGSEKAARGQGSNSISGGFGLDPRYGKHQQLLDSINGDIKEFTDKQSTAFAALKGKKDPSAMNELALEMGMGLSRAKSKLMSNPEYMIYARQQRNYDSFLERVDKLQAAGKDVDMNKVMQIKNAYEDFANGKTSKNTNFNSFNDAAFYENITFDKKAGQDRLVQLIEDTYKPFEESKIIDGPEGSKIIAKYDVQRTPGVATPLIYDAAKQDANIVKMFEATHPGLQVGTPEGDAAFQNYIDRAGKYKAPLVGKETTLTEYGNVVYNPVDYLKAMGTGKKGTSSDGSTSVFGDATDGERELGRLQRKLESEKMVVTKDNAYEVDRLNDRVKKSGWNSVDKVFNKVTGMWEYWEVEVDENGQRPDGEAVRIGKTPIAAFPNYVAPASTSSNNPKGVKFQNHAVSGVDGISKTETSYVPDPSNLNFHVQQVSKLVDAGENMQLFVFLKMENLIH